MKLYQGALISVVLVMGLGFPALRAQAPKQTAAANAQQIERGRRADLVVHHCALPSGRNRGRGLSASDQEVE